MFDTCGRWRRKCAIKKQYIYPQPAVNWWCFSQVEIRKMIQPKFLVTARQQSSREIMFSRVFLCPQGWVGISGTRSLPWWGRVCLAQILSGGRYVQGWVRPGVSMSRGGVGIHPTPSYWHLVGHLLSQRLNRMTEKHDWKHYHPATSLVGGNKSYYFVKSVNAIFSQISFAHSFPWELRNTSFTINVTMTIRIDSQLFVNVCICSSIVIECE